ncbi:amidohydrolase [Microvirga lotononidis]|nr:amidohydrolase [Microvirga lotononidis]WQO29656.1 amidohydrolase [Microvirga lotononidis]
MMTGSLRMIALSLLLTAAPQAFAEPLTAEQRGQVVRAVSNYAPRMNDVADTIWKHPELGYLETATADLLIKELEAHGFKVERNVAGIPTAFVARYGTDTGPVIGLLAEMDALPGFSQAAAPQQQAVEGLASGHACGHHLFGAGSVAAAIAVAQWLKDNRVDGQIRLYGTPAEEGGSGKVYMVRSGLFDDVDVALHWHPSDSNSTEQGRSLANVSAKIRFKGESAHAAMQPERGRSALDGLEAMHHMINLMREHVPQETRIHYVTTNGGAAPNVVPDFAESYLYVRHPDPRVVGEVFEWITKTAEGAALGTGTKASIERLGGVYSVLPNDVLGRAMDRNLRAAGAIKWTPEETAFATELQKTLRTKPPLSSVSEIEDYSFGKQGFYSTDVGDVSWVVPTVGLGTATWVPGTATHSWQAVAAGGMSIGHKGTRLAAETLATTVVELFQSPKLVADAKAEFDRARGGSFSYSALIGDRNPPLDYRLKN